MNLKDTLNLPKTDFPMRGDLVKREPARIKHWKTQGLYAQTQSANQDGPTYVLHDGPPFTNGDVHLGTALNKILKDTILKYKRMRGFSAPYIPGWDCHGLPIEHKVAVGLREAGKDLPAAELREACANFSAEFIETQRAQFERLGVLADWEREYKTMNPAYEATILRTFASFVRQGLVYRSKKPVYWSIPCETALAEAEVEYLEHKSPSIWVKFRIPESEGAKANLPDGTHIVIWTTTPWTLPANLAVAVHPRLDYQVFQTTDGDHIIVAQALAENFASVADTTLTMVKTLKGSELEGILSRHPFIERDSPIVLADYVTTESGTGCVHTAPGHGMDDYLTGLRYGLDIYCPLDDHGCYVADEWMPERLVGVTVLETQGKCPANIEVLRLLSETGALVAKKTYHHQYPHCWRSKTPIIFRAMDQWFVGVDRDNMREKVLKAIEGVDWVPDWGIKRIRGAVENRPDWCISRQRSWGVPLPVFFTEDGDALLDADIIDAIADKVATQGTNLWFEQTPERLLEGMVLPEAFLGKALKKGMDTLDVWIDSGCSHRAVLQQQPDHHWPADLYLEGSDQHRGWFQSSIWTGVIADGAAPYKQVLTHGFIVEESGEKISKSKGAMSSDGWVQKYGGDIVRLWVASQDFRGDIKLSDKNFKRVQSSYRSIRNTLMYQLGNLADFDPKTQSVTFDAMDELDQWVLWKTAKLIETVTAAYEAYEFHRVYQEIDYYTGVTLSRLYHDILKDRLYTWPTNDPARRSSQTAIMACFETLVNLIAPILSFTADEAWSYHTEGQDYSATSVHGNRWPEVNPDWAAAKTATELDAILSFREKVNEELERLRQSKAIGRSLDAQVTITPSHSDPLTPLLHTYRERLPELFIVSRVSLAAPTDDATHITVTKAEGVQCPRCWRWVDGLKSASDHGDVCPRCYEALVNP